LGLKHPNLRLKRRLLERSLLETCGSFHRFPLGERPV
jgi:hypothetical protein